MVLVVSCVFPVGGVFAGYVYVFEISALALVRGEGG